MKTLLHPEEWVLNLYPKTYNSSVFKTLSNYVITAETETEVVLLHTITWSIFSFDKDEYENILNNDKMEEYKIVIPTDFNEDDIANKVYLKRIDKPSLPTYEYINGYVVMTTTSCNARCFYCYEENLNKTETMTKKTADDLIQFMIKHRYGDTPLHIQWFGGEPLLNQRIIDYIVDKLNEFNIPFSSSMISNAFLLNEETITKLEKWNLKQIQITLDGINDDYNKAKNYVYTDVDAYLTVLNNIRNLLEKTNVKLLIRINANTDNIDNLYGDIELLKEEFNNYLNGRLEIYVAPLFGYVIESYEPSNNFWEKLEKLQEIVKVSPLNCCDLSLNDGIFKRKLIEGHCMAYTAKSVVVTPTGILGPCEHIKDEDHLGDIINGIVNKDVIERWHQFDGDEINFCKEQKCPYHPMCPKFYHCSTTTVCEIPEQKHLRLQKASDKLLRTKLFFDEKIKELENNKTE